MEYVAECFWAGVREDDLDRLDERVHAALAASGDVRYGGSMLMPEDEVVFCFFEASSESAIRTVAAQAGVPFARIVESRHFTATGGRP